MIEKKFDNPLYNSLLGIEVKNAITGDDDAGNNDLQGGASPKDTLWSVVDEKVIDATKELTTPLRTTTFDVSADIRYLPASAGEAKPNIQVRILTGVGAVRKDATSDKESDMSAKVVSVPLTRYSRTVGIDMYSAMKGFDETVAGVKAATDAILREMCKDMFTLAATTTNEKEIPEVTPETVAHTLSAAFDTYGDVENLALSPLDYAQLLPTDRQGFAITEGVYGIGKIHKAKLPAGVQGLAWNRNGIAAAFGTPAFTNAPGVEFRTFEVEGIPFRLKTWFDADENKFYHTVDTLAGFALGDEHVLANIVIGGDESN